MRLLRLAYERAAADSDDPSTHNAAILVDDDGQIIAIAANTVPRGVVRVAYRLTREVKANYIIHAEVSAIAKAARHGHPTAGATLFCPWAACTSCAQAIITAGITRIISHRDCCDRTPQRWQSELAFAAGMLSEAGVVHEFINGTIGGGIPNLFDGKVWYP